MTVPIILFVLGVGLLWASTWLPDRTQGARHGDHRIPEFLRALPSIKAMALAPPAASFRTAVQAMLSVALLAASLYVILSGKYDDNVQKWATGTIGTVIGFWLKG